MGFFDDMKNDVKKAAYSAVQRKIELSKDIDLQTLYGLLEPHAEEFPVEFKLKTGLVKHITFKRHPKLELQLLVTVKGNVIKITPNIQEASIGIGDFTVRTADLKNGFGFATEFGRDDYVNYVTERIETIAKEAGY